jgi:anti-anti-sigma factor
MRPSDNSGWRGAVVPLAVKEAMMALQISSRKSGNVTILDLEGRLVIGDSSDLLGTELRKLAEGSACSVLVNLGGVTQVDSSGLVALVRSFITLGRQGGSLRILNPTGHVREVLEVTRLIESIPTYTDEASAIASFSGGTAHT